jgi:hypothetical protein
VRQSFTLTVKFQAIFITMFSFVLVMVEIPEWSGPLSRLYILIWPATLEVWALLLYKMETGTGKEKGNLVVHIHICSSFF